MKPEIKCACGCGLNVPENHPAYHLDEKMQNFMKENEVIPKEEEEIDDYDRRVDEAMTKRKD